MMSTATVTIIIVIVLWLYDKNSESKAEKTREYHKIEKKEAIKKAMLDEQARQLGIDYYSDPLVYDLMESAYPKPLDDFFTKKDWRWLKGKQISEVDMQEYNKLKDQISRE
jgi:hypothetical protein